MPAIVMDGRAVSELLMPEVRRNAAELKDRYGYVPTLAAILVGSDPASR